MPRFALRIEYNGTPFCGWQRQAAGQPSVQQTVEEALSRLEPGEHRIVAAGRTDAGVHATGQVAHADLARDWDPFRLGEALNWHLKPSPIAITGCARVNDDFHARFSAVERQYLFRIVARRAPVTHDAGLVWQVLRRPDISAMQRGAAYLIGRHDFTTFRSSLCQAESPVKTLDEIGIEELPYPGGTEIRLRFRARSFLHNQVRSMVGTLERVGAGAWPPERVGAAIASADRSACGPVAPPSGLYLTKARYATAVFED